MRIDKSRFLSLLHAEAGGQSTKLVLACCGAGLAQGIAIFSIITGLEQLAGSGVTFGIFLSFFASLAVFYYLFHYLAQQSSLLALRSIKDRRINIAAKLRGVPMEHFLKMQRERTHSLLSDSQELMVEAARMFVVAAANSIMMIVAFGRMFSISILGASIVLLALGTGLLIFIRILKSVNHLRVTAWDAEVAFSSELNDLQQGFQHLKIHLLKTVDLFKLWLFPNLNASMEARESTEKRQARGMSFFAVFNLLVLGLLLFLLPNILSLPTEDITSLLVLVIFCITPMMSLISFVPMFGKVEMTLNELCRLEQELDAAVEKCEQENVQNYWQKNELVPIAFENLSLHDVRFEHKNADGSVSYAIHIPSFELKRGEIVFLCGGNGAGKTTFMRLISGLYVPSTGNISLNGRSIADVGMESWRNVFSLVPADFHLFKHTLGLRYSPKRIHELLTMMQIEHKVSVDEHGTFSTRDLSQGQRKRLALTCALLEDRDIYLFDEVSADFDPHFRRYFYEEMLQNIRSQGKTILAISHDDRYFSCADRVIYMADGTFVDKHVA